MKISNAYHGHGLTRMATYAVAACFGFLLAGSVAYVFGTSGAFLVGIVLIALGALLLSSDGDAVPMTAAVAFFLGLAAVAGWIPLPRDMPLISHGPSVINIEPK